MLNEIKIRYFLVLSEYLNFSAAAKELHITQQALSKQISQLEQELDCILLNRTPRGVVLTDAGKILQKAFYSMKNSLEQALVEVKNNARSTGRVLNIGCAAGLRPGPFFNRLCQEYTERSGAQFWLGQPDTYNDLITWLSEDKFDLALSTDDYGNEFSELQTLPLCKTPLYFFVGRDHPMHHPDHQQGQHRRHARRGRHRPGPHPGLHRGLDGAAPGEIGRQRRR